MKKKAIKLCVMLVVLLSITMMFSNELFATYNFATEVKNTWTNTGDINVIKPTRKVLDAIINIIQIVGTGISIMMLTYIAIKYMTAAPSEKAEFKKSATAYVVGAVVLFASSNIIKIIANFATSNI